jgi:hypothetical protein
MSEPISCELCGEPCPEPFEGTPLMHTHRECGLRSVMGGIGHLIAHEYWCSQRGDPDAGLTYRQSALLCDAFVNIVGIGSAVAR